VGGQAVPSIVFDAKIAEDIGRRTGLKVKYGRSGSGTVYIRRFT
jgi:hypothetical protein